MTDLLFERWLEDRREVIERERQRLWWTALTWVTGAGLLCAFLLWDWPRALLAVLTVAGLTLCWGLPFVALRDDVTIRLLLDRSVVVGLVATATVALVAAAAPLGVGVTAALACTSSPCRQGLQALGRRRPGAARRVAAP